MNYLSSRGGMRPQTFAQVLLEGLAPDGGLAVPAHYPQLSIDDLHRFKTLSYADLAFEIIRLYATDVREEDLKLICHKAYTPAVFGSEAIAPLRPLFDGMHVLALSNGPTLAFKDMAMQLLGHLFEYQLDKNQQTLNILGATSGDTGSAAEYAMRGKKGIRVFMLSPEGKMSAFQRAQMFSLMDDNIHNLAVQGFFDDCQDVVKAVSEDLDFKAQYRIGAVNSINWGRICAQVVYYIYGYLQAAPNIGDKVSFAVPSGNFGNVLAGHIARSMGLPIAKLVVATNENNVLDEFFKTGVYRPRTSQETHITSSPSMDISKASNFERFIYDFLGRNPVALKALWTSLANKGSFDLSKHPQFANIQTQFGFVSGASHHQARLEVIRVVHQRTDAFVDTHTADAIYVAQHHTSINEPMVVLETALPIKFSETILEATGEMPPRPKGFEGLENKPQKVVSVASSAEAVKAYIANAVAQHSL